MSDAAHAPSPVTPLLGRWHTDPLHPRTKHQPPSVVPRCMRCQILSERETGDHLAVDRLANQQMLVNVAAWRRRKGWAP